MKNILKNTKSKLFLLLLVTFFSNLGYGQYNEYGSTINMAQDAWNQTPQGTSSTTFYDNGAVVGTFNFAGNVVAGYAGTEMTGSIAAGYTLGLTLYIAPTYTYTTPENAINYNTNTTPLEPQIPYGGGGGGTPSPQTTTTTYFLDKDGDYYYSAIVYSSTEPIGPYSTTTKGFDCDGDKVYNVTNVCAPAPCTKICDSGYKLNSSTCECVKNCDKLAKANLAGLVYDAENGLQKDPSKLPSNVIDIPISLPGLKLTDPVTGFNSALYRVDHGNGNIEFVYATAGTDDLPDVVTDYQQAFSKATQQYQQSRDNAVILAAWAANNGFTLSFTGHSLGGGLANVNALATGLKAIIYNPAGLSDGTVNDTNLKLNMANTGNVTAYVVVGEPVNALNILLDTPPRANTIGIGYFVINGGIGGYKLHLISTVKAFIDCSTN